MTPQAFLHHQKQVGVHSSTQVERPAHHPIDAISQSEPILKLSAKVLGRGSNASLNLLGALLGLDRRGENLFMELDSGTTAPPGSLVGASIKSLHPKVDLAQDGGRVAIFQAFWAEVVGFGAT
jgi:hypothetical protein